MIVAGAFNPTYALPALSPNLNAPSASRRTFVPSQVKFAEPPNAVPPELNWICVLEPPGGDANVISLMFVPSENKIYILLK